MLDLVLNFDKKGVKIIPCGMLCIKIGMAFAAAIFFTIYYATGNIMYYPLALHIGAATGFYYVFDSFVGYHNLSECIYLTRKRGVVELEDGEYLYATKAYRRYTLIYGLTRILLGATIIFYLPNNIFTPEESFVGIMAAYIFMVYMSNKYDPGENAIIRGHKEIVRKVYQEDNK